MPRTKLVLKLIESEKKRKATYKNRRDGLVQKVSQFATLCGVDAFLVCYGSDVAGGEVTTWPSDRATVVERIEKLRALRPEKIRQVHTTGSLLREDLAKQQRALIKVQQCGVYDILMPSSGYRFDELSLDGLNALYDALSVTLEMAHRRMATLRCGGGGDVVVGGHDDDDASSSAALVAVPAPAPYAVALPDHNSAVGPFDFPFVDAAHYYYPVLHDTMPMPLPVYHHLPSSCLSYPMPPPPPPLAAAAFDQGFMDSSSLYAAANVVHGGAGLGNPLLDDHSHGFAAGVGYGDDLLAHGFAIAAGAGAGYDLDPRMSAADVWQMNAISNPNDGVAFQLQNDLKGILPGGGNSGSNLRAGF
uniref:MADS-box domain-containing protein n=1 Tax=Leersia perrieri TaxID=77586 RepID=A0A0D9V995_9ORYZ